jgi:hypothetical protein
MSAGRPSRVTWSAGLALALVVGAGAGCARTHLTPSHGRAYHQAFAVQDANPDRKAKSVHGLDAQEATIIAGSYRKAPAPKSDVAPGQNQLLMVAPQRPVNDSAGLPASVPPGQ